MGDKIRRNFNGSSLNQGKITYAHKTIVNFYIVYEINKSYNISSYPTLGSCLLGAVKSTKNIDNNEYKYSGYGVGFDRKKKFSVGTWFCWNSIIFGVDMSSSVHVDNKKKDI